MLYTLLFFEFIKYLRSSSKRIIKVFFYKNPKIKFVNFLEKQIEISLHKFLRSGSHRISFVRLLSLSYNFLINYFSTVRDETKIKMHFEKFGPVQECKFARNYFGTLKMKMEGAKNEFKFRMEEKRCERNPLRSTKKKASYFRKMLKEDMRITKMLMFHSKENLTKVFCFFINKNFFFFLKFNEFYFLIFLKKE